MEIRRSLGGGSSTNKVKNKMTLSEIKTKINKTIDEYKKDIISAGEWVLEHAELGYHEEQTSAFVRERFASLDMEFEYPLALTGVKGMLKGKSENINVCIIGEMDAIKCVGHPSANTDGIAHACGHHAQIAAMLGVATALKQSGVMEYLDGNVTFFAVPAEEFIDLEYRKALKDSGNIVAFGGKQQLIAEGAFNNIDMAMMIHAQPNEEKPKIYVQGYNLGFCAKTITFHGKTAHGSTPYDGTNALNAAALAILGIHSNRETFRDEERIRIHPIITKGGDVVNSVPDEVCINTYVRGASAEAIHKGSDTVHRAVHGAAQMIGAEANIESISGYLPLKEDDSLNDIFIRNASEILGQEHIVSGKEIVGSTDMGDLSHIIPVIQPSIGGFSGGLHTKEFSVTDKTTAYVKSAQILANTVAELLYDGACIGCKIKDNFVPQMTKEEYIEYLKG